MKQQMSQVVGEAKKLDAEISSAVGNEERQNKLIERRMRYTQQIVSMNRQMQQLQNGQAAIPAGRGGRAASVFQGSSGAMSQVGSQMSHVAGSVPKIGGALGVGSSAIGAAAGAGTATAAVALGALAAAAGGVILSFSRMSSAFEVFSASVPKMITRTALGLGDLTARQRQNAIGLGYTPDESIQQQVDLARSFGTQMGSRSQENMLINTQQAARGLGIDASQISGAGNQLRGTLGAREAQTATAQILSKAFMEGMDKSQATHLLSATTSTIQEINKNGLLSNDALIGAMAELSRNNQMAPEQAGRVLTGMQSAITGSSGTSNAFFQMAMARSGVGAGTLAGSQFGVEQGLFGVDSNQFMQMTGNPQALKDLQALGLTSEGAGSTQNRAKGILGQLGSMGFSGDTIEGRTSKARTLGDMFGAQNIEQAYQIQSVLEKLAGGGELTGKERKTMESLGQDPQARWRDESLEALKTIAGSVAQTKAGEAFTKFDLGKDSATVMNELTKALTILDKSINTMVTGLSDPAKFFGGIAETIGTTIKDALTGLPAMISSAVVEGISSLSSGASGLMSGGVSKIGSMLGFGSDTSKAESMDNMLSRKAAAEEDKKASNPDLIQELKRNNQLLEEGNQDRKAGMKNVGKPSANPVNVDRRKHGG